MSCHVLCKYGCVGVGIVAADDNDSGKTVLLRNFGNDSELLLSFELSSAGTDDIETAGVSVFINKGIGELNVIVIDESAGATLEAEKNVVLVGSLQCVIETCDNVVSAGCLSARKDNADNLLLSSCSVLSLNKGNFLFSVSVREKSLDLLLIRYALCCFALAYADVCDAVSEHSGKLRIILISCFLKR